MVRRGAALAVLLALLVGCQPATAGKLLEQLEAFYRRQSPVLLVMKQADGSLQHLASKYANAEDGGADLLAQLESKYSAGGVSDAAVELDKAVYARAAPRRAADGAVHVLTTVCGANYTTNALPMFRSLLRHRTSRLHLHVVADAAAIGAVRAMLAREAAGLRGVRAEVVAAEPWVARADALPKNFHSHMTSCSTVRLWAHEMLPAVDAVVVVDSGDVVWLEDVARLWQHFAHFDAVQLFGASIEQAHWYKRMATPGNSHHNAHWEGVFRGFGLNAGLLLLNLTRLAARGWSDVARGIIKEGSRTARICDDRWGCGHGPVVSLFGHLGEQDVWNFLAKQRPGWAYQVPCRWNTQLIQGLCQHDNYADEFNCSCAHPAMLHYNGNSYKRSEHGARYFELQQQPERPDSAQWPGMLALEPVELASMASNPREQGGPSWRMQEEL